MSDEIGARPNKWESRKLVMTCAVIALATTMMFLDQIEAAQWIDLIKWTVGPYLIAQAYQNSVSKSPDS